MSDSDLNVVENESKRCLNSSFEEKYIQKLSKRSKIEDTEEAENKPASMLYKYLPMKDGSKNVKNSFKSPFVNRTKESSQLAAKVVNFDSSVVMNKNCDPSKLKSEINRLQKELDECDVEISKLNEENYEVEYLDLIIDKLHVYNDVKDTAQTLLERIAHVNGGTIKQMHELYGIDIEND
jgi:hypothetical protein